MLTLLLEVRHNGGILKKFRVGEAQSILTGPTYLKDGTSFNLDALPKVLG